MTQMTTRSDTEHRLALLVRARIDSRVEPYLLTEPPDLGVEPGSADPVAVVRAGIAMIEGLGNLDRKTWTDDPALSQALRMIELRLERRATRDELEAARRRLRAIAKRRSVQVARWARISEAVGPKGDHDRGVPCYLRVGRKVARRFIGQHRASAVAALARVVDQPSRDHVAALLKHLAAAAGAAEVIALHADSAMMAELSALGCLTAAAEARFARDFEAAERRATLAVIDSAERQALSVATMGFAISVLLFFEWVTETEDAETSHQPQEACA